MKIDRVWFGAYLHFSWLPPADVIKCARNLSATELPSVINIWHKSLLKNAFAPPLSVIAISCIGKFGMFMENALRTSRKNEKIKMQLIGYRHHRDCHAEWHIGWNMCIVYSLQCCQRCTPLRRIQQYESVHEFVTKCIRAMIWWYNYFDFLFRITQKRFKYHTPFARQCTRWLGHDWTQNAFHGEGVAAEHAQNDSYIGRWCVVHLIWIIGFIVFA